MSDAALDSQPTTRTPAGPSFAELARGLAEATGAARVLELGLGRGAVLPALSCACIGVDPEPALVGDAMGAKPALHLYRNGADDFFRDHDPAAILGGPLDLAVIGRERRFEFMLRAFMALERCCAPGGLILAPGCLPPDAATAERSYAPATRADPAFAGVWAGETWKLVEILREHRPDLSLDLVEAAPTGALVVSGLDPRSTVLDERYGEILIRNIGVALTPERLERYRLHHPSITVSDFARRRGLAVETDPTLAIARTAAAARPEDPRAQFDLAAALQQAGRAEEAAAAYRRAIGLNPRYVAAYANLGNLLMGQKRYDEAETCYSQALGVDPRQAQVWCNYAYLAEKREKFALAGERYERALKLDPAYHRAERGLGDSLFHQKRFGEAATAYRRALKLKADDPAMLRMLGATVLQLGLLDEAISAFRRAIELNPRDFGSWSNLLFSLEHLPDAPAAERLAEARRFGEAAARSVPRRYDRWTCAPAPERLRVGVVSGDLWDHVVGHYLISFLRNHDPSKLELFAYPTARKETRLTGEMKQHFAAWRPIDGMSDAQAAAAIHSDGVHVLLDLAGHTAHNRLPVFAWKPAPVQASWIGYFATTGLEAMDHFLVEPALVPPDDDRWFVERPWRAAGAGCLSPPAYDIAPNAAPFLTEGVFTFGCLNTLRKVGDEVVAAWARVLREAPRSRLLMKAPELAEPWAQAATRARFAAHGIGADRLLLEGPSSRGEYLKTYHRVDLVLDPFPYPGCTTSMEGLWMGVPMLTMRGDRLIARVGEHLALNLDRPEWIAKDADDYVAKAVAWAKDPSGLPALRAALRGAVLASPLYDGAAAAENVTAALWGMWDARREGR